MNDWSIFPFFPEMAEEVSALIGRVLMEVNSKDYPVEALEPFAAYYSPETVLALAEAGQSFVALDGEKVIACGSVYPE